MLILNVSLERSQIHNHFYFKVYAFPEYEHAKYLYNT